MTGSPLVSVVIPTHNRLDMLRQAVASVLIEHAVPLQLVVVDDASSDGTAAWLATCADARLEHHVLSPGRGGSGARSVGLEHVRAPHVLFLDDDDLLEPGALPALLASLRRHPRAGRALGGHRVFGEGVCGRRPAHPPVALTLRPWREELAIWNMPPGTMLWRTDVVRAAGGWDEARRRGEDVDLCLRAWRHPVTLVPATVLGYRIHLQQVPATTVWPLDWAVRRAFVDSMPASHRAEGERLLRSRERYQQALEAHLEHRFAAAAAGFADVVRSSPRLALSPLTGPLLDGLALRAAAGAALPRGVAERLSALRRRRRGLVPDTHRSPPGR